MLLLKLEGIVSESHPDYFVVKPTNHLDISKYGKLTYVPFTGDGVKLSYGKLKRIAKTMRLSPEMMLNREIGNNISLDIKPSVKKSTGELGEIRRSLYFECQGISE